MNFTAQALLALALLAFVMTTAAISIGSYRRRRADTSAVEGSVLLGSGLRAWYFEQLQPFEDACAAAGVQPAHLTFAQLFFSLVVAVTYAAGLFFSAGWLLLFTGSLDIIDGRLARRTGSDSRRGAYLDSVVDRYADGLAFLGLAIYFRDSWVVWVVLLGFFGTQMVSYARARGEALGADCRVGALQRPERFVLLGFGSVFGSVTQHVLGDILGQPYFVIVAVLVGLALAINLTALQRAVYTWRALEGA